MAPLRTFAAFGPLSLVLVAPPVSALDNGLALKPPMGWRNWNAYQGDIDDSVIRMAVDAMASRDRLVDGKPTSLADMGYDRVGIDDNWQACGTGYKGSFHAQDGTPLLNFTRFPDLKGLVDYGHSKNLKMGWYNINCICMDTYVVQRDEDKDWKQRVYPAEVKLMVDAGFDGLKIDNCGDDQGIGFKIMTDIINASGRPMLIENCNQGHGSGPPRGLPVDPDGWCGGNFFRTGGDIRSDFGIVMDKLQRTIPYQDLDKPLSRPDCWAYPDMLEVGNFDGVDTPKAYTQHRTHFGAWCIVSSPLYLSMDLASPKVLDSVWDIITNREAIAINQEWAGHPGRLVHDGGSYQLWAKRLASGQHAAIVVNRGGKAVESFEVDLTDLGLAGAYHARDVWARQDLPTIQGSWNVGPLAAYDSAFVRLTPVAEVV